MPEVGVTSPISIAIVVVLPAPLPPSSPVIEPRGKRKRNSVDRGRGLVDLGQAVGANGGFGGGVHGPAVRRSRTLGAGAQAAQGRASRRAAHGAAPRGSVPLPSGPHLRYPAPCPRSPPTRLPHAPRTVRLKTLVALRWFAVIGQAITVLVVHYWLEFDLPLAACLS